MIGYYDLRRLARRGAITAGLELISATGAPFGDAAGCGVIFTLHHVRPQLELGHDPNGHLSITPGFLDATIRQMLRFGYRPVRLDEVPGLLAAEEKPARFFAFTLDDGYRDNARYAAPVFRRHGVPYTIFLTEGFVERTRTMWWETAAAMTREADNFVFDFGQGEVSVRSRTGSHKKQAFDRLSRFMDTLYEDEAVARIDAAAASVGVDAKAIVEYEIMNAEEIAALAGDPLCDFGAHTVTHCDLARVPPERLKQEIEDSIAAVERWTGRRPTSFAYPYGSRSAFGQREEKAVLDSGLRLAVTTRPGVLTRDSLKHPAALKRVSLNGYYQQARYVRALVSGIPFRLAS
jgi:peptidoglycan/xylan/chitin deacetylase (PgdA/CDA1 family)